MSPLPVLIAGESKCAEDRAGIARIVAPASEETGFPTSGSDTCQPRPTWATASADTGFGEVVETLQVG